MLSPKEQCSAAWMLAPQRSTKRLMHTQAVAPFPNSMVHLLALLALLSTTAPPAVAPAAFQFFQLWISCACTTCNLGRQNVDCDTVNTAGNR